MAWFVTICEGRPFHVMVRAAELALALSEPLRDNVLFEKSDGYSPWRHLMCGTDQLTLRALSVPRDDTRIALNQVLSQLTSRGDAMSADELRVSGEQLRRTHMQRLVMRTGDAVTARPPNGAWLLMLANADRVTPHQLAPYSRTMGFSPYAPCAPVVWPVAVNKAVFAHRMVPRHGPVLLIGDHRQDLNLQVIHDLMAAGAKQIVMLDPYHPAAVYAGSLPSYVSHFEACPPRERARLAARSSCVLAAEAAFADNHFLWEAVALGLPPLGHLLAETPAPHLDWTPERLRQAWTAYRNHSVPHDVPEIVDWSDVVARLHGPESAPAQRTPTLELSIGPHQVRVWHAMPPVDSRASYPVVLLSPGSEVAPDMALDSRLSAYREVYIDLRENPELGLWLAEHRDRWAQCQASEVEPLVTALLRRSQTVQLDVVHLDDTMERVQQARASLTALHAAWQSGVGLTAPPEILLLNQRQPSGGASRRGIGAAVAAESIVAGLEMDAPGRYHLTWMGKQPPTSARGRVYLYPFAERMGLDGDEVDCANLPTLLESGKVDLLCHVEPFLAGSTAARATWARKAVPIVGMLHSIHTAAGATEVLIQLLSGPSLACDLIVSPSQCGARAYQGLLDAAAAYLEPQCVDPPRYQGSLEVLPYAIDPAFYADMLPASCRAALSWPQDAPILLCLGRLSRQEKADLLPLLLAVQTLVQHHPKLLLVVAGAGSPPGEQPYGEILRLLAQELGIAAHLRIYEDVATEDKFLLLGGADVVVAINDNVQETYGLSLLEAMAAGRPVVAAGWDGLRELVRHDVTGLLVPTYGVAVPDAQALVQRIAEGTSGYGHRDLHETVAVDPHALTAALQTLLQHPEQRQRMGAAARDMCLSEYDPTKLARRLGDLLLARVEQARHCRWPVPGGRTPFIDPVGQRFAHYPMGGLLEDSMWVAPGAWAAHTGIAAQSPQEAARVQALVQAVSLGPQTIGALIKRLQSPACGADALRARIARCLKYGQLRRVPGP